jgi:tetratricopeptide (TPR) repeat protein
VLLAMVLGLSAPLAAQARPVDRAFDLERRGSYLAAEEAYRSLLAATPSDLEALLGLERVVHQLRRPESMTGPASAALAAEPRNPVYYAVAVRAWAAAGVVDSLDRLVRRWAELEPGSEAPFREWGFALLSRRDRAGAKAAFLTGRRQVGQPDALADVLAQLAAADGDYQTAVDEWLLALGRTPSVQATAVSQLSQLPVQQRPGAVARLESRGTFAARRLAALLAARWGDPALGLRILSGPGLPDGAEGRQALQDFLEEVRGATLPGAARIRAVTLEMIADRAGAEAPRWLADAARAHADAGDEASARRLLARLAREPGAAQVLAANAGATLIGVLIGEGSLAEAERRLREAGNGMSADERERLTHALARAWLREGKPGPAGALLAADSSVSALALRGRLQLVRGDLRGATEGLATAGPFAGDRADATDRAGLLALLQVIDADSLPELGAAFLLLETGDSAAAASQFERVAGSLPPAHGGAELLLLAGRIQSARDARPEAERLFRAALAGSPAPNAAARFELARLLVRSGRSRDAISALEGLILEHPTSSVAPQARRLLDAVRSGTPRG